MQWTFAGVVEKFGIKVRKWTLGQMEVFESRLAYYTENGNPFGYDSLSEAVANLESEMVTRKPQ